MAKKRSRIYRRERGGDVRYYVDLRDLGGRREPLKAPGETRATRDKDLAEVLAGKRVSELQRERIEAQSRAAVSLPPVTTLATWVSEHLVAKAKSGRVTEQWMEGEELRLSRAIVHFGKARDLSSITVADMRRWAEELTNRGLSGGTVRQHLNTVSNLYRRAQAEQKVVPGYNPVAAMMDKPTWRSSPAHWLEVHEAALVLEAARRFTPKREDIAIPFAYELVATALLTGGRPAEVLGLEVDDVSIARKTVTFRPSDWRRLKTMTSFRTVPLWPQLADILRPYLARRERLGGGTLLFPSYRTGEEAMLTDVRKPLDAIGGQVGYAPRELNLYDFRHTFCAARLQTTDHGAPVSPYTVGRELGHGGDALVKRIYGHLGTTRHRSDALEYRVRQHLAVQHRGKPVRAWARALQDLEVA